MTAGAIDVLGVDGLESLELVLHDGERNIAIRIVFGEGDSREPLGHDPDLGGVLDAPGRLVQLLLSRGAG